MIYNTYFMESAHHEGELPYLITETDLSCSQLSQVFDTTVKLRPLIQAGKFAAPLLSHHPIALLFFEPSTRTRCSFEIAAKLLGAPVINFTAASSSVVKGETLRDTAMTFRAMEVAMAVIRHGNAKAPEVFYQYFQRPVLNGGDGARAHPTQALLDYATVCGHDPRMLPDANGTVTVQRNIAIVGDIAHSRVARSNARLWSKLGHKVTLVSPRTLMPMDIDSFLAHMDHGLGSVDWSNDLDAVITNCDYIMMLRVQLERIKGPLLPSGKEYIARFGLNSARLQRLPSHALIMHPGPVNRDVELDDYAYRDPRCVINDQVGYGTAVRMVCLALLAGKLPELQSIIVAPANREVST